MSIGQQSGMNGLKVEHCTVQLKLDVVFAGLQNELGPIFLCKYFPG